MDDDGDSMSLLIKPVKSDEQPQSWSRLHKSGSSCADKTRLEDEFLKAIRELMALHVQQTQALIDGDPEFSRFDVLIHEASEQKELAKYALIAHIESHHCGKE